MRVHLARCINTSSKRPYSHQGLNGLKSSGDRWLGFRSVGDALCYAGLQFLAFQTFVELLPIPTEARCNSYTYHFIKIASHPRSLKNVLRETLKPDHCPGTRSPRSLESWAHANDASARKFASLTIWPKGLSQSRARFPTVWELASQRHHMIYELFAK